MVSIWLLVLFVGLAWVFGFFLCGLFAGASRMDDMRESYNDGYTAGWDACERSLTGKGTRPMSVESAVERMRERGKVAG